MQSFHLSHSVHFQYVIRCPALSAKYNEICCSNSFDDVAGKDGQDSLEYGEEALQELEHQQQYQWWCYGELVQEKQKEKRVVELEEELIIPHAEKRESQPLVQGNYKLNCLYVKNKKNKNDEENSKNTGHVLGKLACDQSLDSYRR